MAGMRGGRWTPTLALILWGRESFDRSPFDVPCTRRLSVAGRDYAQARPAGPLSRAGEGQGEGSGHSGWVCSLTPALSRTGYDVHTSLPDEGQG
ncbi:hypothetical protein FV228_31335 [Methylobacterium sp. WL18]|nr:hypothetical protein FV228_31335 [Methylobacterium sp. WL18]